MGDNTEDVVGRLLEALNHHDVDALTGCFDHSYRSEQPVHPNRAFGGYEQVHKNWSVMFREIPDFSAVIVDSAAAGSTVWTEWRWSGHHTDASRFEMRGVTVMGIKGGRIGWARLYMEAVEPESAGIDEAVRRIAGGN